MIQPEHRDSFAQHAAPEAIEHQLKLAKAARRAAQRDIEWLAELAGRRAAEMAAGVWPPPAAGADLIAQRAAQAIAQALAEERL